MIKTNILGLLILLFSINSYGFKATVPYDYEIDLRFDTASISFTGELKVTWLNESSVNVDEFPFRFFMDKTNPDIIDASINGNKSEVRITKKATQAYDGFIIKSVNPILPNAKAIIRFKFKTENDSYYKNQLIDNGSWIPMLQYFENGEFNQFFQKHSNYKVTITYPSDFRFVTSGKVISETKDNEYTKIVTEAKEIPSYGVVASRYFKCSKLMTNKGILIRSFYFENDSIWGNIFLKDAKKAIDFYCDKIGFYPQPILSIVPSTGDIGNGWPVCPNVVVTYRNNEMASNSDDIDIKMQAEWITAHEIGHQYWGYNYVLEKPEQYGYVQWFGISMGIYTDWLYSEAKVIDKRLHDCFFYRYINGVKSGYNTTVMQSVDTLNKQNFDWNNVIKHGKSFVILRMLAKEVGEDKFYEIFQYCLQNYKGINVTLDLFQETCEKITNTDLEWFFHQWYLTNDYLDYQIQAVETIQKGNKYQTICTINRKGNAYMTSIDIALKTADSIIIFKSIDGKQNEVRISFDSDKVPEKIVIDPKNELPLINRIEWIKTN